MPEKTRLTDAAIQKARAPQTGQAEIWDAGLSGFGIRITPKGVKAFVLLYRHHGKARRWTIGRYPAIGLAKARRMASDALDGLEKGIDPQDAAAPQAGTFGEALEAFVSTYCSQHNKPSTAAETRRNMRAIFLPHWDKRALGTIGKADVLKVTDALIAKGAPSAARHAHSNARKFFAWCVERGLLHSSPMAGLTPPVRAKNRARTLTLEELAAVWKAADGIGYPFGRIVQLLILTGQRRGEVAALEWREIDEDAKLWVIPAERTKNGRAHSLPLAPMAAEIIAGLPRCNDRLAFPARGNDEAAFSGWSKAKKQLDTLSGVTDWTLHDLRRTTATRLAAIGTPPHIVERILNHAGGTFAGVAGVYNRFEYADEMRGALEAWEKALSGSAIDETD